LTYLVSQASGTYLPDWLSYEEASKIISGFADENSTAIEVMIVADDSRGGSVSQTFWVNVEEVADNNVSLWALIVIATLLLFFLISVAYAIYKKNVKKKKKAGEEPDSDSFEEDDDILVEDVKPKNPFAFKKKVEADASDPYKNERYKFYNAKIPAHAKAKTSAQRAEEGKDQ